METNIQNSLDALQDSVYEINRIVNNNLTAENEIKFLKANVDHLNIMLAKEEINTALVGESRSKVENAIESGNTYYNANKVD